MMAEAARNPADEFAGLLWRANDSFRAEDLASAESLTREALELFPEDASALHLMASVQVRQGHHAAAAPLYARLAARYPEERELRTQLAVCHLRTKEYGAARDELERLVAEGNAPELWRYLGEAHEGLGEAERAAEAYREAGVVRSVFPPSFEGARPVSILPLSAPSLTESEKVGRPAPRAKVTSIRRSGEYAVHEPDDMVESARSPTSRPVEHAQRATRMPAGLSGPDQPSGESEAEPSVLHAFPALLAALREPVRIAASTEPERLWARLDRVAAWTGDLSFTRHRGGCNVGGEGEVVLSSSVGRVVALRVDEVVAILDRLMVAQVGLLEGEPTRLVFDDVDALEFRTFAGAGRAFFEASQATALAITYAKPAHVRRDRLLGWCGVLRVSPLHHTTAPLLHRGLVRIEGHGTLLLS
jgi:Flp pilus assembly protein TadD